MNSTPKKRCIFDDCTMETKRMRDHVEKVHLPSSVSRNCLDVKQASRFLRQLGWKLHVNTFQEMLDKVRNKGLYPSAASTKAITAQDQEVMQQLNKYIAGERVEFLISVSPPNCVGSLLHWRLIAGLMNHL